MAPVLDPSAADCLAQQTAESFLVGEQPHRLDSPETAAARALLIPSGPLDKPSGLLNIPAGLLDKPSGLLNIPAGVLNIPSGLLNIPSGVLDQPVEGFITIAEASYAATGEQPQPPKLTKPGYATTRLATFQNDLNELTGSAHGQAVGEAGGKWRWHGLATEGHPEK